jgi:hypothetical protein
LSSESLRAKLTGMGVFEKDYLMRAIQQIAEAIAGIVGLVGDGKHEEALREIADAQAKLAGPMGTGLDRLDASSVIAILGTDKARLHAQLLRLESGARQALGQSGKGSSVLARAEAVERALSA